MNSKCNEVKYKLQVLKYTRLKSKGTAKGSSTRPFLLVCYFRSVTIHLVYFELYEHQHVLLCNDGLDCCPIVESGNVKYVASMWVRVSGVGVRFYVKHKYFSTLIYHKMSPLWCFLTVNDICKLWSINNRLPDVCCVSLSFIQVWKTELIYWSIWFLLWLTDCVGFVVTSNLLVALRLALHHRLLSVLTLQRKIYCSKLMAEDNLFFFVLHYITWNVLTLVNSWRQLLVLVGRCEVSIWHDDNYEVVLASPKLFCTRKSPQKTSIMRGA